MNSPTFAVCENLKVFGLSGFAERTEAARFKRDRDLNYNDRDRVYWIANGRHLPRPDRAKRGSKSESKPAKRNHLDITKSNWEKLMSL